MNTVTPETRLSRSDQATGPPRVIADWKPPRRRPADIQRDRGHGRHHAAPLAMDKTDWINSEFGWLPVFNEVDQAFQVPNFVYGPLFSLAFWYRPTDNAGVNFQYIFSHGPFGFPSSLNIFIGEAASAIPNQLRTSFRDSVGAVETMDAGDGFTVGWHHYCLTVGAEGSRVYVDGTFRSGSATAGGDPFTPINDLYIGRRGLTPADRWFGGSVADTIIFGDPLTPSQVSRLFLRRDRPDVLSGGATGRTADRSVMRRKASKIQTRFQGVVQMPLDLSGDHAIIDGKVNITLNGDVINDVVMLQSKQKEGDPTDGAYLHRETKFQLPTTGDIDPKVGDVVAVSGVSYTVLSVREPFLGDYWGLRTREVSITADTELRNLITLFPAVSTLDGGGFKRTTHPAASADFENVPAKVQLRQAAKKPTQPTGGADEAGKRGFKKVYHVYVSADVPTLRDDDILKDENGKQYVIESWENRDRIDEFSVIICNTPPGA